MQAENGADPLRYEFIVSQVELVGSREEAEACDYSATSQIEGIGEVTVGVSRARGSKCERCVHLPLAFLACLKNALLQRREERRAGRSGVFFPHEVHIETGGPTARPISSRPPRLKEQRIYGRSVAHTRARTPHRP